MAPANTLYFTLGLWLRILNELVYTTWVQFISLKHIQMIPIFNSSLI